jgi:hypothetical protein
VDTSSICTTPPLGSRVPLRVVHLQRHCIPLLFDSTWHSNPVWLLLSSPPHRHVLRSLPPLDLPTFRCVTKTSRDRCLVAPKHDDPGGLVPEPASQSSFTSSVKYRVHCATPYLRRRRLRSEIKQQFPQKPSGSNLDGHFSEKEA